MRAELKKIADLMRSKDEAMRSLAVELAKVLTLKETMEVSIEVYGKHIAYSDTTMTCVQLYDCTRLIFPGQNCMLPWNNVAMWAHRNPDLKPMDEKVSLHIGISYRLFVPIQVSDVRSPNGFYYGVKCFESRYKGPSRDYLDFEDVRLHKRVLLNTVELPRS